MLYAAKAIVFAAVTLVVALVTSFVSFFVGQALLSSTHDSATLSQPDVLRAVVGSALTCPVRPVRLRRRRDPAAQRGAITSISGCCS